MLFPLCREGTFSLISVLTFSAFLFFSQIFSIAPLAMTGEENSNRRGKTTRCLGGVLWEAREKKSSEAGGETWGMLDGSDRMISLKKRMMEKGVPSPEEDR